MESYAPQKALNFSAFIVLPPPPLSHKNQTSPHYQSVTSLDLVGFYQVKWRK